MKTPAELFDLRGRHALITGGGTGLGQAFARQLASAGATVTLAGRRAAPLEQTAALIRGDGGSAHCVALDVSDAQSVSAAFGALHAAPDILVNNAGFAADTMLMDLEEDDWDRVFDANLKGAWLVARAAVQTMIAAGLRGSVINIA